MEEKKLKISLSTVLLFIAILVIAIMGFYIYNLTNENVKESQIISELQTQINTLKAKNNSAKQEVPISTNKSKTALQLGKYQTDKTIDPAEGDGIASIELESNKFTINFYYGGVNYKGSYTTEDNKLICRATEYSLEEGGHSSTISNAIFEFKIINDKQIEFITNKNMDAELVLNKGFVYSLNMEN